MSSYQLPTVKSPQKAGHNEVILVASGDWRLAANLVGWPEQHVVEQKVMAAFAAEGYTVRRANPIDPEKGHGFIDSQRMGMDVFAGIDPHAKLIVVESVWQYSHHVLAGLRNHQGPILTIANWSGTNPGLVGLLNLNGSLTKMGVKYSSIWSQNFDDAFFRHGIHEWLATGKITHDQSHIHSFEGHHCGSDEHQLGQALAADVRQNMAIFGVFDEGCMGMYNAIIDDEMLNRCGVYKERLSQSALLAEMQLVSEAEALAVYQWLLDRGMKFVTGTDPVTDLIEAHIVGQCKMYVAAVRMAERYRCDAIGIQYQLGLADMAPASDLAEGMLNNPDRPPVFHRETGEELYKGLALPHFNEVDECAGLDAFVTNRVWTAMGMDPSTTLHDLRYGEDFDGQFVWVFLISGAAPASHFVGGYAGASSERQPSMYFRLGGGSLKGVSRPGDVVWSRIYVMDGALHCDLGLASAVSLPPEETERRWQITTPAWPIMHAVLHGVSRDQMMARHKANHINVVYADSAEMAKKGLWAKATMLQQMGIVVHLCGDCS
ncbi:MAG: fucose isomerase [Armatimonadetes bacterium]|nr:fucose isomerase [Armatimonadota bacterium]